ncbi:cyclin-U4-1 [Selaginella moellendorffii]|nr:cyclin-U4-1 [Selaginella moellendorffii]XP_024528017.1 cyclin-U4-1 [Selaginella moellendorffii]|eukprot:XP_002966846.2 cyclin-U4-1 [Selaginella moellendorffii]
MARECLLHGGNHGSDLYRRLELNHVDSRSCERPRILAVLSSLLDRVVVKNERYAASATANGHSNLTVFHGLRAPSISIDKYLERIFKYANCSPSCFVVAYVYIDRFIQQKPSLPITSLNVHRLLVTSVMVAAKFLDDAYYNNAYYAKVGGVNTQEMNRLELEFLFHLNFRLQVTVSVFESYCNRLEKEVSGSHIERPLHIQIGCGLDGGVTSATQSNAPDKQRLPTVRCSMAGL